MLVDERRRGTKLVPGGGIMPRSCSCLLTLDQSILLRNGACGVGSTRTVKYIDNNQLRSSDSFGLSLVTALIATVREGGTRHTSQSFLQTTKLKNKINILKDYFYFTRDGLIDITHNVNASVLPSVRHCSNLRSFHSCRSRTLLT